MQRIPSDAITNFFKLACSQGWIMSWGAWKTVAQVHGGWAILDNDSGITDDSRLMVAGAAKDAFFRCTIGPANKFKPLNYEGPTVAVA